MVKRILAMVITVLVFFTPSSVFADEIVSVKLNEQSSLSTDETRKVQSWVEKNMNDGKIPGVAVVIVKGDKTVYAKGFGFANIKTKQPITSDTLFELGSNSKAFTALGIHKLEKQGLIKLNNPLKKYIPWFKMKYNGNYNGKKYNDYVDITLEQLLHHTSGISFKSIGDMLPANGDDALEKTVKTQIGKQLDFYPGDKYQYATVNYDILGLVIQNITGQSFEQYIKKNILQPLDLNNTYLSRNEIANRADVARGYKLSFLKPVEYDAPVYRGNTPAGYFITNIKDLDRWLKIQLGTVELKKFDESLIHISHIPDRTVTPSSEDFSSYASGWSVYQGKVGRIAHGGANPNFSSSIELMLEEKVGVAVLSNLNSYYTEEICAGIIKILLGEEPKQNIQSDLLISVDNLSSTIVIISLSVSLIITYMLIVFLYQLFKGKRKYTGNICRNTTTIALFLLFLAGFGYGLYNIPNILYFGLPWSFVSVWAPVSLLIADISLFITVALFCVLFVLTTVFQKKNDKSLFIIAI